MAEFPVTKPEFIVPSCVNLSTYIQGMSDYEVRCYYTQLVQQWATEWAQMQTEWTSQQQAFEDFKTYVNGQIAKFQSWFDNLDVQNEINNKIDEMADSGELLEIIQDTVTSTTKGAVDAWLGENMTPGAGAPALDSSFTLSNAAAQSKAVGDMFNRVPRAVEKIITTTPEAPYDDFDTIPTFTIVSYTQQGVKHGPSGFSIGTVLTYCGFDNAGDSTTDATVQIVTDLNGVMHSRIKWGGTWTDWSLLNPALDSTLTLSNAAAQSKAVGDMFNRVPRAVEKIISTTPEAPYDDFNTIPSFTIVSYSQPGIKNGPSGFSIGTVLTYCGFDNVGIPTTDATVQIATTHEGVMFSRIKWSNTWTGWSLLNPALDSTLTLSNAAAQSKAVGDMFKKAPMSLDAIIMSELEPPYNDADTIPLNTILTHAASGMANTPAGYILGTIITYSGYPGGVHNPNDGCVQLATNNFGSSWVRIRWADKWTAWKSINPDIDYQENYWTSLSLFNTIAVVGDSYASGEIVLPTGAKDYYNLSWIQNIARMCGIEAFNYSRGGLDTRTWQTEPQGLAKLTSEPARNLYFMALGINDCDDLGETYIGSISDIRENYEDNPDTFFGNYGKIYEQVKAHAPGSKIVFLSLASLAKTDKGIKYDAAIKEIADHYGVPFINLNDDEFFNSTFYNNTKKSGHPIAITYAGMATAIMRLFSKCCIENASYFSDYVG